MNRMLLAAAIVAIPLLSAAGGDDETSHEPPPGPPESAISALIEQSSLGTPGARALRSRTPNAIVSRITTLVNAQRQVRQRPR